MQYKQASRIVREILLRQNLPLKINLKLVSMVYRDWPKLGPFKKRSAEQTLWKVSSDGDRSGRERWAALEELVKIVEAMQPASSASMESDSRKKMLMSLDI